MTAVRPSGAGDGGSVTAELAVALPSVVMLLAVVAAVAAVVVAQVRCVDAARAGARAAARHDGSSAAVALARLVAPSGARVSVAEVSGAPSASASGAGRVRVEVRASVRLLLPFLPRVEVSAAAVADREPEPVAPASATPRGRRDRGSGTILAVGLCGAAAVAAVATATLGSAVTCRHRGEAAADLAALAAVDAEVSARPPCAVAAMVAEANGAHLSACRLSRDRAVRVTVLVGCPVGASWGRLPRSSTAGPAVVAAGDP
jgi:secretion/DNA translocation related TadE-like protein